MYDTNVTVVGNVLTAPEWRRTKNTGSLVANFKVASTARRLNKETGEWVDGNSFRVRVTCWRRLAEGVGASLITGDPVIVVGRLYTREWVDDDKNRRIGYELEAVAVGHDLSRGQSKFLRTRAAVSTNAVEDEQAATRVGGELTDPVPPGQVPVGLDDSAFDELGGGLPPVSPAMARRGFGVAQPAGDDLNGLGDDDDDDSDGDDELGGGYLDGDLTDDLTAAPVPA